MQKTKLHHLKQVWFYLYLTNLILAWNSTKSAPLNGHYPKLQFPTYIWFSHAQSHLANDGWYICCQNVDELHSFTTSIKWNIGQGKNVWTCLHIRLQMLSLGHDVAKNCLKKKSKLLKMLVACARYDRKVSPLELLPFLLAWAYFKVLKWELQNALRCLHSAWTQAWKACRPSPYPIQVQGCTIHTIIDVNPVQFHNMHKSYL